MAYKKNEEHAFVKIGKDMKAGKIPGLVLLYGDEEYLVNFYAEALIGRYVNKACEALDLVTLDRDSVTVNSIIENLETMPLMSERKVVYLPDFIDAKGRFPKALSDSQNAMDQLIEYMNGVAGSAPDGMLLLVTMAKQEDDRVTAAVKKTKFYKAFQALAAKGAANEGAAIYDFGPLDPGQLRGFIEKRFHASGKAFKPGIVSLIAREVGYDNKSIDYGLFNLENDLRKIIAHAGDAPEITPADVSAVITLNPENNVFAMIDAIGRNRKDEAFRLLQNLLTDGSSEFQLLSMITKQLELMLTTCEMKDMGMNLAAMQQALKKSDRIHEFRTQKAMEAGNRFGSDKLRKILMAAYEVETNIKTGLMPGQLSLEFFIAGI